MRICVFSLALVVVAQPAFAKSHSHKHVHQARAHHAHAHHHVRQVRVRPMVEPGAAPMFARTDAADRPLFSDPSFPSRAWSQNQFSNQNPLANQTWAQPAQPFGFGPPPRVRVARAAVVRNTALDAAIARHAAANGLPVQLVHRVVKRESGYNPRASSKGNYGLMQIRHATARGIGYSGSAAGLLDPETNLTYAVKYLAGAYRAAGGNAGRAVSLYASGYHGRGVAVTRVARRQIAPVAASGGPSAPGRGWQSAPVSLGGM
jgi:soluble lytic murein transglycosylase-like protein